MVLLSSSAIHSADYDPMTQELRITFTSGATPYIYFGVPAWKYSGLLAAASAGQYFNDVIRDQHSSNR